MSLTLFVLFAKSDDGSKGIPVGKPVAILGEEGDPTEGAEVDKIVKEATTEESKGESQSAEKVPEPPKSEEPAKKEEESSSKPAPPKQPEAPSQGLSEPTGTIYASPLAKRLALERGIPLKDVKGTGPDGRIVKADIDSFKPAAAAGAGGPVPPASPAASPAVAPTYTDVPLSGMRKVIGERLLASKTQIPHYYVTSELNVDRLLKMREVFNSAAKAAQEAGKQGGKTTAKISVNDFMMKAAAAALSEVPEVNQSWLGDGKIRQ